MCVLQHICRFICLHVWRRLHRCKPSRVLSARVRFSHARAAKGRGKKRKGAAPRPPPLLLVQEAEAALTRIQERVSALLLRSVSPAPPTPTKSPSSLPRWTGAALLWEKSALLDGDSSCLSDFYSAELQQFFTLLEPVQVRDNTFIMLLLLNRGCSDGGAFTSHKLLTQLFSSPWSSAQSLR